MRTATPLYFFLAFFTITLATVTLLFAVRLLALWIGGH